MTSAASLVAVATPPNVETEILDAFDARQKLQRAIEDQTNKRAAAEFELARSLAKEIRTTSSLNIAEAALQKSEAGRTADERAKQRIDAMESILEKINNEIERLKTESSDAVTAVLTKRLDALKKSLADDAEAKKTLMDEIKNVEAEIKSIPKRVSKKK